MLPTRALTRLAVAGLVMLALTACGRRGALESPEAAARAQRSAAQVPAGPRALPQSVGLGGGSAEADPDAIRAGDELSASAVPPSGTEAPIQTSRGAKRGYRIPKDPFILDPLL
ncbi:LPS translocon maturation chaperone LptM [Methylobacterium trifolii]|uniref:LPS translocon maturation chaperone LptM n=1 Tax=Methylobacterium trifolii TaxID=1003092 RepID=UPI001EDFEEBD|nr:hypothetical protein [Methylobacterium trifolii]